MSTRSIVSGLAAFSVAGLLATSTQAALLAYEGFDYTPAGTVLENGTLNGGTGWALGSGWEGAAVSRFKVAATGLTYTGLAPAPIGGSATQVSNDKPGARRVLASAQTSGTVYMSTLMNIGWGYGGMIGLAQGANPGGSFAGFGLVASDDGTRTPCVTNGAGFTSTPSSVVTGGSVTAGQRFLVAKIDLDAQTIKVFADVTPGDPEPASATATTSFSGYDTAQGLTTVVMYSYNRFQGNIDEIRLGNTYADVTAVPEPTSIALLGLGSLGLAYRRRRVA